LYSAILIRTIRTARQAAAACLAESVRQINVAGKIDIPTLESSP